MRRGPTGSSATTSTPQATVPPSRPKPLPTSILYAITDWLGLVPAAVCLGFGAMGATQLVRRRSLFAVDSDLLPLGVYYILIAAAYLVFEAFPINYRPIPIDGVMEAS
ncbi:MAG: hypothetical protein SOH64_08460 [Olsenella sp.]|jgi:hypothetical protein